MPTVTPYRPEELDRLIGDRATDWSARNAELALLSGVAPGHVMRWRRAHVAAWTATHGTRPRCPCGRMFGHVRACDATGGLTAAERLERDHAALALDPTVRNGDVARMTGMWPATIVTWRRARIEAHVAAGNPAPICRCGKPLLHVGSCVGSTAETRQAMLEALMAGASYQEVAARHGTSYQTALTSALVGLAGAERDRRRDLILAAQRRRRIARREREERLRWADDAHRTIAATVGHHPERHDAVQQAYLTMLEDGSSPTEAARSGRRHASRMATVGWNAASLNAPIGEGTTTRMDLLADVSDDEDPLDVIDAARAAARNDGWDAFTEAWDEEEAERLERAVMTAIVSVLAGTAAAPMSARPPAVAADPVAPAAMTIAEGAQTFGLRLAALLETGVEARRRIVAADAARDDGLARIAAAHARIAAARARREAMGRARADIAALARAAANDDAEDAKAA